MNFNKSKSLVKEPVIRKSTVRVAIAGSSTPVRRSASASSTPVSARPANPDRFKLSSNHLPSRPVPPPKRPSHADRALSASRGLKRKSVTPQLSMFSSDEEDGGSSDVASGSDISRKRIKSSVSSIDSGGPRRALLAEEAFIEDAAPIKIIHGSQITSGKDHAKFKNPWSDTDFDTVRLQYPSRSIREKFELKMPKSEYNEYQPLEDIKETIFTICNFYFPPELEKLYNSEENETGFQRRFSRAAVHRDIDEFIDIVKDFNRILDGLIKDGRIKHELLHTSTLHLDWIKRILDQVYARTVSPQIETLRAYENGTDNVYGELLTGFVSKILEQTRLTHDQVFIDLGSGVGNVVLQAALECGAESWGIEMMPNPAALARLQAREFRARARLWGLSAGSIHLHEGDFTSFPSNKPVLEVLARADVVLVNNQAFTPSLNDKLRDMFLDLKDGCRVVSLKPFVPEGHKITNRNVGSVVNLFVQQKFTYFSNSVSWTDQMGSYYIARKDKRPLEAFLRRNGGGGGAK